MPTTFSDLPEEIYIAIIEQVSDFRSLVALSRVNHKQAALVLHSISQERWRCLLAKEHIGMPKAAAALNISWRDLAGQIVNHCDSCRLCKTVLDDVRLQSRSLRKNMRALCKPLSPLEAKRARVRIIKGAAYSDSNRDGFQKGGTVAPLPLFSLWPKEIMEKGQIRLSLSAALVLDNQDDWASKPENRSLLERHRDDPAIPDLLDLRQDRYRLDRHIVLGSLFVTTLPICKVRLTVGWYDQNPPSHHTGRGSPQIKNEDGITVYDVLRKTCKLAQRGGPSTETPMKNCKGMSIHSGCRRIAVSFYAKWPFAGPRGSSQSHTSAL